jgi:hypothetical protein
MVKEKRIGASKTACLFSLSFILLGVVVNTAAQDRAKIKPDKGRPPQDRLRAAVPDFKSANADPQTGPLNTVFNQTLWNDLEHAGIFDLVAKKFYPSQTPSQPADMNPKVWVEPPRSANILIFGNLRVNSDKAEVQGWLYDVKSPGAPAVLNKQYEEDATPEHVRMIAHHFAGEIIARQGGGSKYDWYVNDVRRKVQQSWLEIGPSIGPFLKAPHRALIEFDIMIDGTPANVHAAESSGVPGLDISLIRAIQRIDSFGKPPTGEKITVDFWFDYPPK